MLSPEKLRMYPIFSNQNNEILKEIAFLAEEKTYPPGQQLFFEGEVANTLFIIEEGSVMITMNMGKKGEQEVSELSPLGKGEIAGWSSIVEPHVYKLGGKTNKETQLIAFDGSALRELFDDHPVAGYYFLKKLSEVIGKRLISKCSEVMSMFS